MKIDKQIDYDSSHLRFLVVILLQNNLHTFPFHVQHLTVQLCEDGRMTVCPVSHTPSGGWEDIMETESIGWWETEVMG